MSGPGAPPAAGGPAPAARGKGGLRRWAIRIAAALAALLLLAVLFRGFLVRSALETAVTRVTGFPLEIESVGLGLTDARVEVEDLRLRNPAGFEDPRCLHVARLVADVDFRSLFTDDFHAEEIVLAVPEIVVVKNAAGETNLDRLRAVAGGGDEGAGKAPGAGSAGRREGEPGKELRWRCDRLRLKVGKVVFLDFSRAKGGKPKEETWDLGVDEEFRDLTSPDQIVRLLLLKVVTGTPIRLLNATVDGLKAGLEGVAGVAGGILKGAGGALKGAAEGIGGAVEGILGGGKKEPPPEPPKKPERRKR